ncbi:MAG: M20/M25/M40 family metallo-hydrolase [Clostridia bacterium]|nr:M20/M25/M40 family metallo-hydrolase [Clostridia bacterium]
MKTKKITLIAVVLLLCIVIAGCLVACGPTNPANPPAGAVYGDYGYQFLNTFNSTYNKRSAGTEQELAAANYIKKEFESFGYTVEYQQFNFSFRSAGEYSSQNVIAVKEGKDTSKQIIIGAHYDSVSDGYGIDDNASGVAAMLESAKYFSKNTPSCNIVFVAFGAEEVGMIGSKEYVNAMTEEEKANTKLMINIDSIAGGDKLYAYTGADEESQAILAGILKYGKDYGLVTQEGKGSKFGYGQTGNWSDHKYFKNAGIKFIYFEGTNWDCDIDEGTTQYVDKEGNGFEIMHTPQDTLDWIEKNFPGRAKKNVGNCVKSIIELAK